MGWIWFIFRPRHPVWLGPRSQADVFAAYARADVFALASKAAADGDQEGMPEVLQEAGHQGMAIVSTRSAGIAEFVESGVNGLLVLRLRPRCFPPRWRNSCARPNCGLAWAHARWR